MAEILELEERAKSLLQNYKEDKQIKSVEDYLSYLNSQKEYIKSIDDTFITSSTYNNVVLKLRKKLNDIEVHWSKRKPIILKEKISQSEVPIHAIFYDLTEDHSTNSNEVDDYQLRINQLFAENQEKDTKISSLERENTQLRQDNDNKKHEIDTLISAISDTTSRLKNCEEISNALEKSYSDKEKQLNECEQKNQENTKLIDDLQKKLDSVNQTIRETINSKESLTITIDELQKQIKEKDNEIDYLKNSYKESTDNLKTIQSQLQTCEEEKQILQEKIKELQKERDELDKKYNECTRLREMYIRRIAELEYNVATLKSVQEKLEYDKLNCERQKRAYTTESTKEELEKQLKLTNTIINNTISRNNSNFSYEFQNIETQLRYINTNFQELTSAKENNKPPRVCDMCISQLKDIQNNLQQIQVDYKNQNIQEMIYRNNLLAVQCSEYIHTLQNFHFYGFNALFQDVDILFMGLIEQYKYYCSIQDINNLCNSLDLFVEKYKTYKKNKDEILLNKNAYDDNLYESIKKLKGIINKIPHTEIIDMYYKRLQELKQRFIAVVNSNQSVDYKVEILTKIQKDIEKDILHSIRYIWNQDFKTQADELSNAIKNKISELTSTIRGGKIAGILSWLF